MQACLLGNPDCETTAEDIQSFDSLGRSALHYLALGRSNLETTKKYFNQLKPLIGAVDGTGRTALMLAAERGNVALVSLLKETDELSKKVLLPN